MKKVRFYFGSSRGSALIAVILVMSMLIVLGGGILWASSANVQSTVTDKAYKDSYYKGEAAVAIASDSLKKGLDEVYSGILGNISYLALDQTKAQALLAGAIGKAKESLPAELKAGAVAYSFSTPVYDAGLGGYVSSGTIAYSSSTEAMNRKVGVEVTVKLLPLARPATVTTTELTGSYVSMEDAAIIAKGNFLYNGKIMYLYQDGRVYLNPESTNEAEGFALFDGEGKLINFTVKGTGDNTDIMLHDMSYVDWLTIDVIGAVSSHTETSGNNIYVNGNLNLSNNVGKAYEGKNVFVNGNLNIIYEKNQTSLDLSGATSGTKFFVTGKTTINMEDANKYVDSDGFNKCMIFSHGDITCLGKPDYLYEKTAGETASMYMYSNGNIKILGGNSSDLLNLVAYAKGDIVMDFQPRIKGQLIAERNYDFLAENGRNKLTIYYDKEGVGGFYKVLSGGIGGIIDPSLVTVTTYGDPIVNTTEIPYVNIGSIQEIGS